MASKANYLSLKDKQNVFVESDNQYNNLNLNQNYQRSVDDTVGLKAFTNDSKKGQNNDFSHLNESKKESNSWNKCNKHLSATILNQNHDSEEMNEFKGAAKSANNSTLSLHIAAYENAIEATNESDDCEMEDLNLVKKWGILKHFVDDPTSIIDNPFEFPRQQENQAPRPELMQFSASQRLLNPNKSALFPRFYKLFPYFIMALKIPHLLKLGSRSAQLLSKANTSRINLAKVMSGISIPPSKYPLARRDESIVDDFHGTKVVDPYRWMENPDFPETQAWVTELNKISEPFLAQSEDRDKINHRLTALWDYEKYGCTGFHGDYYYYWYNSGLQNQSVLYQQKNYKEKGTLFFDPNVLAVDGTTALRQSHWTEDGKLWAYGLSEKGSDWMTVMFKSASGEDLSDVIKGVKHSSLAWLHDNSGVFYSRYPEHKGAAEGTSVEKHEYHSLYFHKLGTSQSEDFLVADFRQDPNLMNSGTVTEDGRYLLVYVSKGCDPVNQVYYYDLESAKNKISGKLELKPFFDKADAKYDIIDTDGDTALVLTNHQAPFFKLIRVKFGSDGNDPSKWEVVIPEDSERKLSFASAVDENKLMVGYLEDCCSKLYVNDIKTGKVLHRVPLEIGSLSGLSCDKKRSEVFFSFESFLTPTVIYRFDFKEIKNDQLNIEEIRRVQIKDFDPSKFKIQQVFTKSKDGTKIPMFIVHRADIKLDGQNVTILNGYGGFNVAEEPCFSISRILFLNNLDGVVACANLRGGSEYGEKWHENGMLHKKQNVFDDFIACAEYLIDNKFASPQKLAIHGGSNGGLLVGAVSQQRPDIIGAAINRVGVLDMLRFHKFTVGGAWLPEYGNPEKNKDDFEFIYKYSPLHNIRMKPDVEWPATLLMSADHDDRVVSAHSLKYIAQLYYIAQKEAAEFQKKPLICRIEVKAGHGAGKPTSKIIAEVTDIYAFVSQVLGAKYHD